MFGKKLSDTQKLALLKTGGLIFLLLAIALSVSTVSYLFHWREDMCMTGPAANLGGRLGADTGEFLIGECFGLGSFALIVIFAAAGIQLLFSRWEIPLLKTAVISLAAAMISSLLLAYAGWACGLDNILGGGLGGKCGAFLVGQLNDIMGPVVTAVLIIVLILCFLFLCSSSFTLWFSRVTSGSGKEKEEKKEEEEISVPEPVVPVETPVEIPLETPAAAPQTAEGDFEIVEDGDELGTEVTEELKPINNRMDPPEGLPRYKFPTLDLLDNHADSHREVSNEELARNNNQIRAVLSNYKIQITSVKALVGPTVTLYKVQLAPGVKIAEIKKLQEDIAISLGAKGVRVVTLSDCVGIEVANDHSSTVALKALLNSDSFHNTKAELPVAIGYTITREVKVFDLADAPHLLVAGATKQGKSVGLNVIVSSLLYHRHPSELKFVFIDPKMVEFSSYAGLLHHYLAVLPDSNNEQEEKNNAIVKNPKSAEKILRSLCMEMDERYELLSKAGVNNLKLYNEKYKNRKLRPDNGHRFLPYLVVVVDEYADLTMTTGASPEARAASKSITNSIIRLAQKGRAAGLHVILATQRPSVDVISGVIKSNFPMRIAFRVASRVDSQTILDSPGAEKLIGRGDMLFSAGIDSERIQCGFVSGEEIDRVTSFISDQSGFGKSYNTPYYLPIPAEAAGEAGGAMIDMTDLDERFAEAARMIVTTQRGSTSDLQRKLGMGYAKAGRVMDQLQAAGIVGEQIGSKPREVLVPDLETLEPILKTFMK